MINLLGQITERGWLVILATLMFTYIISLVAFVDGLDDSQLFTALASGVGGAVFRDVIGMWTSSTKSGAELADKAIDTLRNQTSSTSLGNAGPAPDVILKPGETAQAEPLQVLAP